MAGDQRVSLETATPSVFEKEVAVRRPHSLVLTCLLLLGLPLAALEFRLNGSSLPTLSQADIGARVGRLVLQDGKTARGLALGEVYPLLSEAWLLTIGTGGEERSLERPGLADELYTSYLLDAGGGSWDLVIGENRYASVASIDIRGEVLAEDGLEVWLSWEGVSELKAEIARFAREKGKRIKVLEVPNTQTKFLALARAGGRLPDLVMIQSDYIPALVGGKLLQAVDYISAPELSGKGFEAFSAEGRRWAIPFYYDAQLVFYRKDLVPERPRPDWDLADMEAMATSLKGKIKAPLSWNVYSAYWLLPFMSGFGKDRLLEPGGGIVVDDEPTKRALEALLRLRDEGLLEPAERDAMVSWFASGQAAFILAGSYSIPEFSRLGLDFGVAPYPTASAGGRPIAPLLDFKGFALSRRTEHPLLARRLLEDLTRQTFQRRFTAALGKLPASETAWAASKGENPWFEALSRSAEVGIVVPPAEAYGVFKNTMWKLLRLLLSGQMGVEECLSVAQGLIDENLEPRQ